MQLWVLEYVQEEEELRRRKSSSRRSLTLSESDFDPAVHGDRHLPVVQSLRRSITPPTLPDIIEGTQYQLLDLSKLWSALTTTQPFFYLYLKHKCDYLSQRGGIASLDAHSS